MSTHNFKDIYGYRSLSFFGFPNRIVLLPPLHSYNAFPSIMQHYDVCNMWRINGLCWTDVS